MRSPEKAVAAASGICPVSAVCRRMMMRGGACAVAIVLLLLGAARCATTPDPVASSSGATTFDRDTTSSGPTTRAPAPDGRGWVTSSAGHESEPEPLVPWAEDRPAPPPPLAMLAGVQAPHIFRYAFPNGLHLVVVERRRRPIVETQVVFEFGSTSDPKTTPGATFFSIAALGGLREEDENGDHVGGEEPFSRQVWDKGGHYRFNVASDYSTVGILGYAQDAREHMEMLYRAIARPRCGIQTFEARRNDLIYGLEDLELNDEEAFYRFLSQASFGVEHVYARPVYGTLTTLKRIVFENVIAHQRKILRPDGATLLVVGDVRAEDVIRWAGGTFGAWSTTSSRPIVRVPPVSNARKQRVLIIPRPTARSMAICATRAIASQEHGEATLDMLAAVLGGGMNSRLGVALRARTGLSYSFFADVAERRHGRALIACTRVRKEDTDEALAKFLESMKGLLESPPTVEETDRARATELAEVETEFEGIERSLSTLVHGISLGRVEAPAKRIEALKGIGPKEVHRAALALLDPSEIQILLAGEVSAARRAAAANRLDVPKVVSLVE
ncbi:MAG: insulinase family protein [Deltaproteobacteria bacterium]|nr:insulinase family protein [Deltaproteobacteria bacterium]